MRDSIKISAVIITFNEEENIERCIKSVLKVTDEVVVVDSFSKDRTKERAIELGARFIEHAFEGHIEQKNFALSQSKYDWVLSLDADEELSSELEKSILQVKSNASGKAYRMNRLTSYCGHWIRHSGWYPDSKIRLWNKNYGKWGGTNPHDSVVLSKGTEAKKLHGDLLHFSYTNISEHIRQIDKFTSIAAKEDFSKGKRTIILIHLLIYPSLNFLKNYILRLGFLDGYYGYLVCKHGAFYRYLKYVKLLELYKKTP